MQWFAILFGLIFIGIDLLHFDDFTIDSICHGEYNLKRNFKRQLNILKGVSSMWYVYKYISVGSSCLNVSFQSENGGLMGPFSLFLDPDDWVCLYCCIHCSRTHPQLVNFCQNA